MADSFNKKERAKKKAKKRQEKAERKKQKKLEGKKPVEFMYMDQDGNFTSEKPTQNRTIKAEDIVIGVPKREPLEDEPIKNGVVKYFDLDKGYGFIEANDTDESFFVHVNNLIDPIKLHDKVTFEVEMGPKGPIAVGVKLSS